MIDISCISKYIIYSFLFHFNSKYCGFILGPEELHTKIIKNNVIIKRLRTTSTFITTFISTHLGVNSIRPVSLLLHLGKREATRLKIIDLFHFSRQP